MKQLIKDLQEWLVGEGRCSGCGRFLEEGEQLNDHGQHMIVCSCSRLYIYNKEAHVYEKSEGTWLTERLNSIGGRDYVR